MFVGFGTNYLSYFILLTKLVDKVTTTKIYPKDRWYLIQKKLD